MHQIHPAFRAPENETQTILRYVGLSKLISLLKTSKLFLTRSNNFDDKFEGSISQYDKLLNEAALKDPVIVRWHEENGQGLTLDRLIKSYKIIRQEQRYKTFVNCWTMDEHESMALWKTFIPDGQGVAIKSTYRRLADSIKSESDFYIGMVKYYNTDVDIVADSNLFTPFLHKLTTYSYEKEIRLIVQQDFKEEDALWIPIDSVGEGYKARSHIPGTELPFLELECNLDTLVDSIILPPNCPRWLIDVIEEVIVRFGLHKPIMQSRMDDAPEY